MFTLPVRTGLIGFGLSGRVFHAPFIESLDGYELTAVSSRNSQAVSRRYPNTRIEADSRALIDDPDLDLLIITAPNALHFSLASEALRAHKHVVLEKPAVTRLSRIETLAAQARANRCLLTVFQNRRFDGDFLCLRQLLRSGELGRFKHLESRFDRFRPVPDGRWREQPGEGSGIFWDLGPHLIDQTLVLFGAPERLTAQLRQLRDGSETVDWFDLQLHYPDFEVTLASTPFEAGRMRRFNARFDRGSWQCWGLDPQEQALRADQMPWHEGYPDRGAAQQAQRATLTSDGTIDVTEQSPPAGHYGHFYLELLEALRGRGAPPVSLTDACALIYTLERAEQSSLLGRTLDWDYRAPV